MTIRSKSDYNFSYHLVSQERGAKHLGLDHVLLDVSEGFDCRDADTEEIYVIISGQIEIRTSGDNRSLRRSLSALDVVFLRPGDGFSLSVIGGRTALLIRCYAIK